MTNTAFQGGPGRERVQKQPEAAGEIPQSTFSDFLDFIDRELVRLLPGRVIPRAEVQQPSGGHGPYVGFEFSSGGGDKIIAIVLRDSRLDSSDGGIFGRIRIHLKSGVTVVEVAPAVYGSQYPEHRDILDEAANIADRYFLNAEIVYKRKRKEAPPVREPEDVAGCRDAAFGRASSRVADGARLHVTPRPTSVPYSPVRESERVGGYVQPRDPAPEQAPQQVTGDPLLALLARIREAAGEPYLRGEVIYPRHADPYHILGIPRGASKETAALAYEQGERAVERRGIDRQLRIRILWALKKASEAVR